MTLYATAPSIRIHRQRPRRGMALIFVVSLILFITLLGASFVVMSQQFRQTARARTRLDARGDNGRVVLQRAFYDLLRGPALDNTASPLRSLDLLSDIYGYGHTGVLAQQPRLVDVTNPTAVNGSEFLEVEVSTLGSHLDGVTFSVPQPVNDFYNGQVMTFVDGPAKGMSMRIVDYVADSTNARYYFYLLPDWKDGANAFSNLALLDQNTVVLNGRPFAGKGAGQYNSAAGENAAALSVDALRPNRVGLSRANLVANYADGGVNESYDSADFQNMFLASMDLETNTLYPSFDRATLYRLTQTRTNFRAFGDPNEPLQVDNDGDGIPDSIWIDPGYAIQTDVDGRRYKPLVAYMVRSMGGRFQLAAHGSLFDLDPENDGERNRAIAKDVTSPVMMLGGYVAGPGIGTDILPQGQGYGPAEISLEWLFRNDASDVNWSQRYLEVLASDATTTGWYGRYGQNQTPGGRGRDFWSQHLLNGYPDHALPEYASYGFSYVGGNYSSTLDLHGRYSLGFDTRTAAGGFLVPISMPVIDARTAVNGNFAFQARDSAYEASLVPTSYGTNIDAQGLNGPNDDQAFTAQEVERVLRQYDRDAKMLPSRLLDLAFDTFTNPDRRHLVGAEDWEVPALPLNPVKLLSDRLLAAFPNAQLRSQQIELMLSHETRSGLPMDLNFPFGDGRDNNNNGIFDEHAESTDASINEAAAGANNPESVRDYNGNLVDFDHDGDGVVPGDADAFLARYHFARHLYVLAALVLDTNVGKAAPYSLDTNGNGTANEEADFEMLAQWVANVVDFRDGDSINTPFEFDINPFNGWGVDGWLGPGGPGDTQAADRRVVWGAERPEMLLTEGIATHDRKLEDLGVGGGTIGSGDSDSDSRYAPTATAFVELYNPWVMDSDNQLVPNELYRTSGGVDLSATSLDGSSPVWRLTFVRNSGKELDPDDRSAGATPISAADVVRKVYFTSSAPTYDSGEEVYFPSRGSGVLGAGQHAILGSSGTVETLGGTDYYHSWFGRRTDDVNPPANLTQTRGITLIPDEDSIELRKWDSTTSTITTQRRSKIVVVPIDTHFDVGTGANQIRSFGLSDPLVGYDDVAVANGSVLVPVSDGFEFQPGLDQPADLDGAANHDPTDQTAIMTDQTTPNFRICHLQRLANPLAPFDPVSNPYLTIDSMSMDLTAFNGVSSDTEAPVNPPSFEKDLESNERGADWAASPGNPRDGRVLWQTEPIRTNPNQVVLTDNHFLNRALEESFVQVNRGYRDPAIYAADLVAFPWLTWNNRPFVSQHELLDVPYPRNSRLMAPQYFVSSDPYLGVAAANRPGFSVDALTGGYNVFDETATQGPFRHLLNFFGSSTTNDAVTEFHRLLEFVRVPSRFARLNVYREPVNGVAGTYPPYNAISTYREPGKVNLNEVLSRRIWKGLTRRTGATNSATYGDPTIFAFGTYTQRVVGYDSLDKSRVPDNPTVAMAAYDNPFRSSLAGNWVPQHAATRVVEGGATGLMRRSGTGSLRPLFEFPVSATPFPHMDTKRNAYFRYQPLKRLGNLTTTRSSVFAIWITVGRFEVDANGNLLSGFNSQGVELGSDTGKTRRYRSFHMIDRSIPVAFEPGQNHNVDKLILSQSFINE